MEMLFKDILNTDDVEGIMLFSHDGEMVFDLFPSATLSAPHKKTWWPLFMNALKGIREADLIFEKRRLYVRKTDVGYLIIVTGLFSPMAMLRLNCDIVLPSLKEMNKKKGLKRFFKGKR